LGKVTEESRQQGVKRKGTESRGDRVVGGGVMLLENFLQKCSMG